MKKWIIAAAAAVALMATSEASAQCPSNSCGTHGHGGGGPSIPTLGHLSKFHHPGFGWGGGHQSQRAALPVYMAAPWYLYWPYDGHFQTVAPMAYGAFYQPPVYGGNPYLPVQNPGYVPAAGVPVFPASR